MSPTMKMLTRLSHPTVWEDLIPGALYAMPKVVTRFGIILTTGHLAL
jgi:hypothetical protein